MQANQLVLLIDDDPPTARMARLILEAEGYEVRLAVNRQDALALIDEIRPSVVIMDYLMAGMSPSDFIERSRRAGFEGPIILCTAMAQRPDLEVDDVLLKPFDPDELPRRIRILLAPE